MNRKTALIAGGALAVLLIAWYLVLWEPATKDLTAAQSRQSTAQTAMITAGAQRAALRNDISRLPSIEATAKQLDAAAPTQLGVDTVIDQISAVAAATGVVWHGETIEQPTVTPAGATASSSTSGATAAPAGIEPASLTMSVTGTFEQLLAFDTALSHTPRLINVSGLGFGAASGSSSGSQPSSSAGSPSSSAGLAAGSAPMTISLTATMYVAPSALPAPPKGL